MWPQRFRILGGWISLYELNNTLGAVAMVLYDILLCLLRGSTDHSTLLGGLAKKFCTPGPIARRLGELIETLILSFAMLGLIVVLNRWWAGISTDTSANFFGVIYFVPIAFLLLCWLLGLPPLKTLDRYTVGVALMLIFLKIACFCHGCCHGAAVQHSFYYSVSRERYEFPVQLVEAACALLIFYILLCRSKKRHIAGTEFPLFALLYSGLRFCSEFARDDFPPLLGILTVYQLQCIAGVLLGVAALICLWLWSEKVPLLDRGCPLWDNLAAKKGRTQKK